MSPKDNVQLIVSIKKRLIGYFIEARIINQYFLNDFSIIYFKRILRKKTIRDLEQGNQLILGNNQIFTNGFIRQEKSSVNLYVNSIELKNTNFLKEWWLGKLCQDSIEFLENQIKSLLDNKYLQCKYCLYNLKILLQFGNVFNSLKNRYTA